MPKANRGDWKTCSRGHKYRGLHFSLYDGRVGFSGRLNLAGPVAPNRSRKNDKGQAFSDSALAEPYRQ
jgi:hypothetical protein